MVNLFVATPSFDTIIEFLTAMRELGIKPEHECFDAGHVANLDPLIDMGLVTEPHQISHMGHAQNLRRVGHGAKQSPQAESVGVKQARAGSVDQIGQALALRRGRRARAPPSCPCRRPLPAETPPAKGQFEWVPLKT